MFYTYRQCSNNGSHIVNDTIAHYVCVEANSETQAHAFLVSLSSKAIWGECFMDDEPVIEHSKGVMPLCEFITGKHNQHRRRAIVYYADGRKEMH